jgi:hypothetical protein
MSSIVLSAAVRQNLLALQNTAALMATTQNDLATGNKVNSALDNPTNFFTSSGLNNRAGDISNLLDGISNGVQVLQAANSGITSIQSLVASAKSIANQALQSAIGYSTKAQFTSSAVAGATANNILGTANSSGTFTGTAVNNNLSTPAPITGATKLSGGANTDSLGSTITAGDTLTVNGQVINFAAGTGTNTSTATGATIYLGNATSDVQSVLDAINTVTGTSGATATATLNAGGQIVINSGTGSTGVTIGGSALAAFGLNAGTSSGLGSTTTALTAAGTALVGATTTAIAAGTTLVIPTVGNATASLTVTFGTGAGQVSTLDQLNAALAADNLQATQNITTGALTISTTNDSASASIGAIGGSAITSGLFTSTGANFTGSPTVDTTSQTTRANLVSQYNAILTQIDNTAADSSYNGVNLLSGDQLELTFNETGKSKVNITGVQFNSAGLGLSSLASNAFQDNNATNTILTTLNTVSTKLRSQASAFGSNLSVVQTRQDFNKSLINVLQTGAANLTQADINEEAANSQALQTRQSLSVSALSLANQAQQSVLQLLR